MYNIEFSKAEYEYLAATLSTEIEDLRGEVRHTKNNDYKESLKRREEMLKTLLVKFSGQLPPRSQATAV